MSVSRLIVFAGLPGVGKSTVADGVARALQLPVLSVDPIEEGMAAAGIPTSLQRGLAAYLVAARSAHHILRLDQGVIVEAANAEPEGRAVWLDLSERTGVPVEWIHVTCSNTQLHRSRLEQRCAGYPGVDEPTWEAVTARAAGLQAWASSSGDGVRIVVDSTGSPAQAVADVLAQLPPADDGKVRRSLTDGPERTGTAARRRFLV